METGRWRRIQELFHEAADIAPAARPAFLSQACGGDQELRRDVESLLASDIPSEAAFRSAVDQAVAILPTDTEDSAEFVGTRIGRYSITGLIGKGGMGAVYRAVREDDFRMQVAIKLLKRGTDTEAALGRFRIEPRSWPGYNTPTSRT